MHKTHAHKQTHTHTRTHTHTNTHTHTYLYDAALQIQMKGARITYLRALRRGRA